VLAFLLTLTDNDDDRAFFTQLYERNEKVLFVIANRILHTQEKAEEAVQDAFVKAIEHLSELRKKNEDECRAWLIVVVRHISFNTEKKESQVKYVDPKEEFQNEQDRYTADFTDEISYKRLKESIRELPDIYKNILYLRFVCEWSYGEIAKETGLSENLISTRVMRGREILMRKLQEENSLK